MPNFFDYFIKSYIITWQWVSEIFPAKQFTESQIKDMRRKLAKESQSITQWNGCELKMRGLLNTDNYLCYMNAVLQCLMRIDSTFSDYWLRTNLNDKLMGTAFSNLIKQFCVDSSK
jgi:ubiquitin C-terminal hydrolase